MAVHKQTYGELTTLKCGHPQYQWPVDRYGVWHRISGDDLWKACLGPFLSLVIWKSIQFASVRDNIDNILICFDMFCSLIWWWLHQGIPATPSRPKEFRRLMLEDEWVASKLRSACERQLKQASDASGEKHKFWGIEASYMAVLKRENYG